MSDLTLRAVPRTPDDLIRFGNGDQGKAKSYLLALYGFLVSKPESTRRAYQYAIREFFELWNWRSPEEISVAEAAYYKRWLKSRDLSDATICLRLSACQSYFEFLMKPTSASGHALLASNPFRLVTRKDCTPTPYGRSTPVEWADFEKIIKSIPDDPLGKRDKALLLFFATTGRGRTEVARLRVRDLNLTARPRQYTARVKGGKLQTFELSDVCHDAILDYWISSNRLKTLRPDSSVFGPVNQGGGEAIRDPHRCLTVDSVVRILKRNAERAGLDPRRFKLHGLRHMFARDLDESDARLQGIQTALGHVQPNTTAIYTGKLRGPAGKAVQGPLDAVRKKAAREASEALG